MNIILERKFPYDIVKKILDYKNQIEKIELGIKIINKLKNTIEKDMNYGVNIEYSYFYYYFDYRTIESNTIMFLFILFEGFIQKNKYYSNEYISNLTYFTKKNNIYNCNNIKADVLMEQFLSTITMKDCIIFYKKIKSLCNDFTLRYRVLYHHELYYDLNLVEKFMIYSFLNDGKTVVF